MISDEAYNRKVQETLDKLSERITDAADTAVRQRTIRMTLRIVGAGSGKTDDSGVRPAASETLCLVRKDTGDVYILDGDMSIGRDEGNAIVIAEPAGRYVSGKHATISVTDREVRLRDRPGGSRNGTFINGKKIRDHRIKPGDRIKFADVEFTVLRK